MNKTKQMLAGVLTLSLLYVTPAMAASQQELQQRKNQNEQNIKNQEKAIDNYEVEIEYMTRDLQNLDKEITECNSSIDVLDSQISAMRSKIKESERELQDINKNIKSKREMLEKRLQAMYVSGKTSYIELVLSCSDISDLLSRTQLISSLVEHDTGLIESLENYQKDVKERKSELDQQKKDLSGLQELLEKEKKALEDKATEKEKMIEKIQGNLEYARTVRQQMYAEQEAIDAQIRAAAEAREREMAAKGQKLKHYNVSDVGQMAWPVPASGNVTSEFGRRDTPFAAIGDFHTGLDISAPAGTPIIAARAGTVVYAGWGGYGVMVIIDHGGGLYTLYGHGTDGSISVSNGQQVSAGDVIMGVGSTGYSTGPHLHFEVRVGGNSMNNAVNPRQFL